MGAADGSACRAVDITSNEDEMGELYGRYKTDTYQYKACELPG